MKKFGFHLEKSFGLFLPVAGLSGWMHFQARMFHLKKVLLAELAAPVLVVWE